MVVPSRRAAVGATVFVALALGGCHHGPAQPSSQGRAIDLEAPSLSAKLQSRSAWGQSEFEDFDERPMSEAEYQPYLTRRLRGMNLGGISWAVDSAAFLEGNHGNGVNTDLWLPPLPNVATYRQSTGGTIGWFRGWLHIRFLAIDDGSRNDILALQENGQRFGFVAPNKTELVVFPMNHIQGWFTPQVRADAWRSGGDYQIAPTITRYKGDARIILPLGKRLTHHLTAAERHMPIPALGGFITVVKMVGNEAEFDLTDMDDLRAEVIVDNLDARIASTAKLLDIRHHQKTPRDGGGFHIHTTAYESSDSSTPTDPIDYEWNLPESIAIKMVRFETAPHAPNATVEYWKTEKRVLSPQQVAIVKSFFDFKTNVVQAGNEVALRAYVHDTYSRDPLATLVGPGKTYKSIRELFNQIVAYDYDSRWTSREQFERAATVWIERGDTVEVTTSYFNKVDERNDAYSEGNHHMRFRLVRGTWVPLLSRLEQK